MVGQQDTIEAKERCAADDRAEIVRISDAIEDQQGIPVPSPLPRQLWNEVGDRPRAGHRHDVAMKDSAGDPLQFRLVDLPEGLSFAGEIRQNRATSPFMPLPKNRRSTRAGSRSNSA
jgi:hypothetical protein